MLLMKDLFQRGQNHLSDDCQKTDEPHGTTERTAGKPATDAGEAFSKSTGRKDRCVDLEKSDVTAVTAECAPASPSRVEFTVKDDRKNLRETVS